MKSLTKIIGIILGILGLSSKATSVKKAKIRQIDRKVKQVKDAKKAVNVKMKKVKNAQKKSNAPKKRKKIKDAESFLKDFAKK